MLSAHFVTRATSVVKPTNHCHSPAGRNAGHVRSVCAGPDSSRYRGQVGGIAKSANVDGVDDSRSRYRVRSVDGDGNVGTGERVSTAHLHLSAAELMPVADADDQACRWS
jgi:hypothetical protein